MKEFKEFWRTVVINGVEHPRYQVSNLGRVKRKWLHGEKWKICKLTVNQYGYSIVTIDGMSKRVHRIVAEAFLPNPQNKPYIDHIFTIKTQNVVLLDDDGNVLYSTIRWCTHKENCNNQITKKHISEYNGKPYLGKFGSEHNRSMSIVQLTLDGQFIKKWSCASEVERELEISRISIVHCLKGRSKSAGGFRWMYYDDWLKLRRTKPLF